MCWRVVVGWSHDILADPHPPGADAWVHGYADANADVVPSAAQLAAWFAHPSATLDDAWDGAVSSSAGGVQAGTQDAAGQAAAAVTVSVTTGDAAAVPGWVELEWLDTPVRAEVRALMCLVPGPGLVAALASLPDGPCPDAHAGLVVEGMPVPGSTPGFACACQVVTAAAWDAMTTWTATQAAVQLVDIAGQDVVTVLPDGVPVAARTVDRVRMELAPMLRLSPDSTGTRLAQGRNLTEHPVLVDACAAGLITAAGARAILGETSYLSQAATAKVVTAVVAKVLARRASGVAAWTATDLGRVAKRAAAALDDDDKDKARKSAYEDRRVSVTSAGNGMAWLSFLVRDVDAHRIYNRLTAQSSAAKAHAKEHDTGDDRTADQHRADIAVATLLGHTHGVRSEGTGAEDTSDRDPSASDPVHGDGPADAPFADSGTADSDPAEAAGAIGPVPRPGRPEINVLVTLSTLLGLAQDPGHVPGLGPIHPEVARELAADGKWRVWITDPATGRVVATGSRGYTPSAALARLIRAREPTCRMPGCNRQSVNCDLDHTVPYPGEPGTTAANLGPLCRRDHNLKTHHGFDLVNNFGSGPGSDPGSSPARSAQLKPRHWLRIQPRQLDLDHALGHAPHPHHRPAPRGMSRVAKFRNRPTVWGLRPPWALPKLGLLVQPG